MAHSSPPLIRGRVRRKSGPSSAIPHATSARSRATIAHSWSLMGQRRSFPWMYRAAMSRRSPLHLPRQRLPMRRCYAGGQRQSTALLRDVDPPLHRSASLASVNGDRVFLGDPELGRIIAVEANGALIGQLQADAFRGLSRIVIDATGNAVYVLHNHTVSVVVPPKPRT